MIQPGSILGASEVSVVSLFDLSNLGQTLQSDE
jgi:hypothetical protein